MIGFGDQIDGAEMSMASTVLYVLNAKTVYSPSRSVVDRSIGRAIALCHGAYLSTGALAKVGRTRTDS